MKITKETVLLFLVVILVVYNIFNTNGIKTDVDGYVKKIDSIQVKVDSAQVVNKEIDNRYLPNYYADKEKNAAWYSTDNLFTANFLFDKLIKNLKGIKILATDESYNGNANFYKEIIKKLFLIFI